MTPRLRKWLFETLYSNRYLYRFASTVPFAGQWRVWQRLVLPRITGRDVLELGCGLGDLLADMAEAGHTCYAVEQSPEMIEAARNTLKQRKLEKQAWVIQGTAQHLPFSDQSFDTVVSTFPAEYIYDPDTSAEVERVLRPGGRLIVVEAASLLPVGLFQPFLLLIQALVYGPAALFGWLDRHHTSQSDRAEQQEETILHTDRETDTGITATVIPDADFGRRIPLEDHGLLRRSELVRSRKWEVYITIGEKTQESRPT